MTLYAFDIETTGLTATDVVTTIGVTDGENHHIYYNASQGEIDPDSFPDASLYHYENEYELLSSLRMMVTKYELQIEANMLVGFHSGRFDFPFLRTRCVLNDMDWPLASVNHIDLEKTFQYNWCTKSPDISGWKKKTKASFGRAIGAPIQDGMYSDEITQTIEEHGYTMEQVQQFADANGKSVPTSSQQSLDGIYDLFFDEEIDDPFDSSEEAVSSWMDGDIEPIVQHNLSDLKKTHALVELARNYVPQDEFVVKKL